MIVRDDEKVKRLIAANIAYYRKQCNLTQAELAQKINYSDKSVSKWERAEGVPDIFVLVMLADLFGLTVNDFFTEKTRKSHRTTPVLKRSLVTLMSIGLVWLVATVIFFALKVAIPSLERAWLAFIIAVPVSFIVATVLTILWHPVWIQFLSVSGIVWSIAMTLDITFDVANMYLIYTIAAALQVLIILWYFMKLAQILIKILPKRKANTAVNEKGSNND